MRRSSSFLFSRLGRFGKDQRGVSAVIVAVLLVVFIELCGLVIDFGRAFWVQHTLQAQVDAAALAGGYHIPPSPACPGGCGIATATTYSGVSGNKNAVANIPATMVSGFPVVKCLASKSIAGECRGTEIAGGANAIQVKEQSVVPTFFTRIVGINSLTVSALATASARGGNGQALNVMVVLDTTTSMGDADNGCGLGNSTREQCALAGLRALLQGLNPQLDYVGLMVFPGLQSASQAANATTCGRSISSSNIQTYNNSPVYTIVGLTSSNDFKTSSASQTLNPNSSIVLAAGGGGAGCTSGINRSPPGGVETYFAMAISQAQTQLSAFAAPHTQNVIIALSDGAANSDSVQTNVTGYISGTTLTVMSCPNGCAASTNSRSAGPLSAGASITGTGVTAGTAISSQLTGTTGGVGTYQLNKSMTVGRSSSPITLIVANVISLNGTSFVQNTQECQQAIAAAQVAAAAGTWVYSVAYGADTNTGGSSGCTKDTTGPLAGLSTCTTMQNIASDSSKFYSDSNRGMFCPNSHQIADLVALFKRISQDLTMPRLIPDNTP